MNAAEIKVDLFRKLDSLKGNRLEEAYGLLLNYINGKSEINEWDNLTIEQKDGLMLGLDQLNKGQGKKHSDVMSKFRKRFLND